MASIVRPTMVSNPSSRSEVSSPPPSPVETATPSSPAAARRNGKQALVDQHHHYQRQQQQPLPDIDTAIAPATKVEIVVKTPTNRPRLPGRQETPPSPPSSVVLGPSPVSPEVPLPVGLPAHYRMGLGHPEESTPPASLKQRITRVFKVGHKRGESDLSRTTNATDDTIQRDTTSNHQPTPLKENSPMPLNRPSFYATQSTGQIRPTSQFNIGGSSDGGLISGGEVRVEILPHPNLTIGNSSKHRNLLEGSSKKEQGSSDPYGRYNRSSELVKQKVNEEEEEGMGSQMLGSGVEKHSYLPPLNRLQVVPQPSSIQRRQTATTIESAGSQERRYVEESMSFGFEGFHIGDGSGFGNGTYTGLSGPNSPMYSIESGVYAGSGKASSSVLNYMNQSDPSAPSRNGSNKTALTDERGSHRMSRPVMSRNASSNSCFSPGIRSLSSGLGRSGSPQFDEAVNRELKRLSKISAGSGASGFAMIITADGAASTRFDKDFSDEEMDVITSERKFTKEEKGKGKAVPSASTSATGSKDGESHGGYQGAGHHHTISDASKFIRSDGSEHSSDNGDSDGKRLLPGIGGFGARRKLKSQEVPKGVLVHEGDPRYEFVYRMRQTSDETPILVPQYFYPSDGFPSRNALTTPTRSTFSPLSSINTSNAGAMPFAGQYGSSPIAMPKNALTRDSSSSFYIRMMGGDQAVDSRDCSPRSPRYSEYGPDTPGSPFESSPYPPNDATPIRPMLRSPEQTPVHKGGRRQDISVGDHHGIEMDMLVTGTPGGTGRRLAGSSLAGGSDTVSNDRFGVDARKQVRMSGIDEVNFVPPLQDSTINAPRKKGSRGWLSLYGTRLPRRPKDLRRSMTPRLYDPRRISDSWTDIPNDDPEAMRNEPRSRVYRMQEKRLGRIILALCILFPPLLLLVAIGSFDAMVDSWSNGEIKGVGKPEKKIAAIVGGVIAVGAVVGGVVAAILAAS